MKFLLFNASVILALLYLFNNGDVPSTVPEIKKTFNQIKQKVGQRTSNKNPEEVTKLSKSTIKKVKKDKIDKKIAIQKPKTGLISDKNYDKNTELEHLSTEKSIVRRAVKVPSIDKKFVIEKGSTNLNTPSKLMTSLERRQELFKLAETMEIYFVNNLQD